MTRRAATPFTVAAVQAAPVFLDHDATIERACDLIARAARGGAKLVVFPEAFVPGYPDWVWVLPARERAAINALYAELVANAVAVPGPAVTRLSAAARAAGAHVVIGVNERNDEASGTSLYNALLFFDDRGELIGRHRKLIPTGGERLMWAQGDGSTLRVYDTSLGKMAGLLCWENYMPLARYAMYSWGAQILIAPTWDRGEPWLSALRHVAREGRLYVIGCCQALHRDDVPDRFAYKQLYPPGRAWINAGDSAVVDPDGQLVAGPLHEKQDILFAEIDPARATASRWMFDPAGHYARPDVFRLTVHRRAKPMLDLREGGVRRKAAVRAKARRPVRAKARAGKGRAKARARTGRSKKRKRAAR